MSAILTLFRLIGVPLLSLPTEVEVMGELALVSLGALALLEEGAHHRLGVCPCQADTQRLSGRWHQWGRGTIWLA